MTVKSIIGIVIITLNLAGVCYIAILTLASIGKNIQTTPQFLTRTWRAKDQDRRENKH